MLLFLRFDRGRLGIVIVAMLALSGCTLSAQRYHSGERRSHIFNTNYELGRAQSASVGEVVLSVKDYYELRKTNETVRPNMDFRVQQAASPWYSCSHAKTYPIVSTFREGGRSYRVVAITPEQQGLLLEPDGRPYRRMLGAATSTSVLMMLGNANFEPKGVIFEPGPDLVTADTNSGFVNFELLYDGTDGRSFSMTYREYTPQDLIRPGFSQTLRYEISSPTIRFRAFVFKVLRATSERIEYVVLADGLSKRAGASASESPVN